MGQGRLSSKAGCALSQPCTTWECAQPPTWNMRHIHAAHSAALQQRGSQRLYCSEEQTRHCTSCISSARPAKAETQGGAGDSVDVEVIHSLQRQNGKGEFFCLVKPLNTLPHQGRGRGDSVGCSDLRNGRHPLPGSGCSSGQQRLSRPEDEQGVRPASVGLPTLPCYSSQTQPWLQKGLQ